MVSQQHTVSQHTEPQYTEYALLLGIDWADVEHEVCWWNAQTQQRTHQQVKQDPNALHAWLGK